MSRRILALLAAAIVLLTAACSAIASKDAETSAGGAGEAAVAPQRAPTLDSAVSDEALASGEEVAGAAPIAPLPPLPNSPATPGDRVIKDGRMTLEVGEGDFEAGFQRIVTEAQTLGGFVVSSTTRTVSEGVQSGSVTVRVPVDNYEELLTRVGDAGTVRSRDVTSQDVSGEVVDLESRLRHLQAQETFYLDLLGRAQTIQDAISVQQQLDGLQGQIEQIKGRLQLLNDRTAFSTLTVDIVEPGTPLPLLQPQPGRPSLARYWESAQDAFINVIGAIMVAAFFLAPLLIPAALIGLLAWRLLRRRPTPAPQPDPAPSA